MRIYRFPLYGHTAAAKLVILSDYDHNDDVWTRTDGGSLSDLVVFKRIKIILDSHWRTFLDRPCPEERIRCRWNLHDENDQNNVPVFGEQGSIQDLTWA